MMARGIWLALVLLAMAGPASAQSEEEVTAAVGPQIDAYTLCLKQHAQLLAKGDEVESAVIDKALAACGGERQALWEGLQQAPLNAKPDDATDAVQQLDDALRPKMLATIKQVRGV